MHSHVPAYKVFSEATRRRSKGGEEKTMKKYTNLKPQKKGYHAQMLAYVIV